MPVYRPPFIKQLDGSRYGGVNCTMASAAMAAARHTRGKNPAGSAPWYPRPSDLRTRTGDRVGGTTLAQADSVLIKAYGINLDVEYGIDWAEFRQRVTSGAGAILQGSYDAIYKTKWSGSNTFRGNHAVYVNEVRWNASYDRWEWLWYDPLLDGRRSGMLKGPQWVPDSIVRRFAFGLMITDNRKIPFGKAYAALTRDTEDVIERYGGKKITPIVVEATVSTAARRAPRVGWDIARGVEKGTLFKAYQSTVGDLVKGTKTWYGNADGNQWVPAANFKKV